MTTTPKISVIVPVYNVEEYLSACVDTILAQSFTNFELLLIDDGSTDSSGQICDQYATKDCRIKVFHQANKGVSSARNIGLDNAVGEWICFVDGDDNLCINALNLAYENIPEGIDWCILNSRLIAKNAYPFHNVPNNIILKSQELYSKYKYTRGSVWGCLYSRTFLNKHKIRFTERIANSEDSLFVCLVQYYANYVACLPIDFYNINVRVGSASRNWTIERLMQCIDNLEIFEREISRNGIDYKNSPIFNYLIYGYIHNIILQANKIKDKAVYRKLNHVVNKSGLYPIVGKNLGSNKIRINIIILNLSTTLYSLKLRLGKLLRKFF